VRRKRTIVRYREKKGEKREIKRVYEVGATPPQHKKKKKGEKNLSLKRGKSSTPRRGTIVGDR